MTPIESGEVERTRAALGLLFETAKADAARTLCGLDERSLREAFRLVALRTHPDRAAALGGDPETLSRRFAGARRAHDWLRDLLSDPPRRARMQRALSRPARTGFHIGPVPRRRLRFAEFLYYSRMIHQREVIRAVQWQASRRPRLGDLAAAWGRIDGRESAAIERARRPWERYGECAVRTGALTPFWVRVLLGRQRALDRPIGAYFVERGVLDEASLARALERHHRHNLGG